MNAEAHLCDVIVVGGGPAGTTAATFLAKRGWRVVLFERDAHPRFHIGESLLPMNVPILERLGVLEAVRRIGVEKPGADFTGESGGGYRSFPFSRALAGPPGHAFQVRREDFDRLLFENALAAGVHALTRHRVLEIEHGRAHQRVRVRTGDGSEQVWRGRFAIDASGQDTLLAKQHRWRVRDRRHASAAMFAHFSGVPARPGAQAGNISVYWFRDGWLWMIPLPKGVMSVGAVCSSDYLRRHGGPSETLFRETLALSAAAGERLLSARQLMPMRAAANYSYCSARQTGPGYALIGDAFTFVDPVFSTGVYVAMSSAEALVPVVEHWLEGRRFAYRVAAARYRIRVRRGINTFKWFIYRFTTPAMALLFEHPRNVFKVEQAVVSMLAGDVYDRFEPRARLLLFKLIYLAAQRLTARRAGFAAVEPPE